MFAFHRREYEEVIDTLVAVVPDEFKEELRQRMSSLVTDHLEQFRINLGNMVPDHPASSPALLDLLCSAKKAIRSLRLAWENHNPQTVHEIRARSAYKASIAMEREIDQCTKKLER